MKACVIVPVYNHGAPLPATIERLAPFAMPIIVVDDGSGDATKRVIDAIARQGSITVVTLPRNGGKGAAVMAGLRAAAAAGFTHAVQVDADGQHDIADLPKLLAAARADPEALVCGAPQFDDSVPRSRLYGRQLTSVWVAIETLSLTMPDTMCGYRVYPLATCCALLDSVNLGKRMDFDIEIAVRLRWRNVRIAPIPTRVIYPDGGTSNFRLVRDNGLISKLHCKLVLGMLIRLPLLLARSVA